MKRNLRPSALFLVVFSVFLFFAVGCGEKKDEPSGGKIPTETTTEPPLPPMEPPPTEPQPQPEPQPPASPVLTVTATATPAAVQLSWTATVKNSGNNKYQIQRAVEPHPVSVLTAVDPSTTSYTDTAVIAGTTISYTVLAFEGTLMSSSNKVTVDVPLPELPPPPPVEPPPTEPPLPPPPPPPTPSPLPDILFEWPKNGSLIQGPTEIVVRTGHGAPFPGYFAKPVRAEVFLDGMFIAGKTPAIQLPIPYNGNFPQEIDALCWFLFEFDTSQIAEGTHTLSATVWVEDGRSASLSTTVEVNAALLRKRALNFLYTNFNSLAFLNQGETMALKWEYLPIPIEVSTQFTPEVFDAIERAAAFWTRHTDIPFSVMWRADAPTDPPEEYCFNYSPGIIGRIRIRPLSDAVKLACGISREYAISRLEWSYPGGTYKTLFTGVLPQATKPTPLTGSAQAYIDVTEIMDPTMPGGMNPRLVGTIAQELMYALGFNPTNGVLSDPWGKIALEGSMQLPKYCDNDLFGEQWCFSGNSMRVSAVAAEAIKILYAEFLPGQAIPLPVP